MKDEDLIPLSTTSTSASANSKKDNSSSSFASSVWNPNLLGRGRYKFYALAAILLLALWSMFTGTVTLRWSAGNLNHLSEEIDSPINEDLDVLEMEEREKVVKRMWDVYSNSRRIKLPRFWQEAFEAAYEDLTSDVSGVKESAISEIALMSVHSSIFLEPPPIQSSGARDSTESRSLQHNGILHLKKKVI